MDWSNPPAGFTHILFDRVDPEKNEDRFYYITYQPTLFDSGAVVSLWGRKGGWQRMAARPAPSLSEAWPTIRASIRKRLLHGYRIVAPAEYCEGGAWFGKATGTQSR